MSGQNPGASHLFTVRLWLEELDDARTEWRGQLTYVLSGEVNYFRDWSRLVELLNKRLPDAAVPLPDNE